MNKILYILRGIPGSGKSFIAKQLVPVDNIFSTDNYWGLNYDFDITKLGEAHKWNQIQIEIAMNIGTTPIAVDNTNITVKDISPYIKLATKYNYNVIYKEPTSPWWIELIKRIENKDQIGIQESIDILYTKNIHNVPRQVIEKMVQKWVPTIKLINTV